MRSKTKNTTRPCGRRAVFEPLDQRQLLSASIAGNLVNDNNANYSWDAGDTRNVNWQVYLDANDNQVYDDGELTRQTDQNGYFAFQGLEPGTYVLRQVLPEGWRQTFPRNVTNLELTIADGETVRRELGSTQAISAIVGTVFNDADGNGVRGPAEQAAAFRAVYFDDNNNGRDDPGERWTTTDASGNFSFDGLPAGEYRIRLASKHGWTQTFGGNSALAVVNGRGAVWGLQFAHKQDADPLSFEANRLMSFMTIGGSNNIAADRRVGYNIKSQGWTGFVQTYIQPQLSWGVRRIMLHNPFGTLPGEVFVADQAIHAREAGLNWLLNDFVQAWQPITSSGVEVIAYMGTPRNSPDFDNLGEQAWWDRVHDSFSLPIAAGMNIGLDMSLAINPGDREWTFIEEVRNQGLDVYGEPRPPAAATHWTSSRLFAEESMWQYTNPETNPETYWAARDSQITGDVTRQLSNPPTGQTWATFGSWAPAMVKQILREGHTAAFGVSNMIAAGITMQQLLAGSVNPEVPVQSGRLAAGGSWNNPGDRDFSTVSIGEESYDLDADILGLD